MVEVDPADPSWRARKHTAMGRVRRERDDAGRARPQAGRLHGRRPPRRPHLEVRQRRAGARPRRRSTSRLLEKGAASPASTGRHQRHGPVDPLVPDTPVDPIAPSDLAEREAGKRGVPVETVTAAKIRLPKRIGVAGQTSDGSPYDVFIATESGPGVVPDQGGIVAAATLGDYYTGQGDPGRRLPGREPRRRHADGTARGP